MVRPKKKKKKKKRKSNAGAAEKQLPYQDTGRHLARALFLNGLDLKWKSEQRLKSLGSKSTSCLTLQLRMDCTPTTDQQSPFELTGISYSRLTIPVF